MILRELFETLPNENNYGKAIAYTTDALRNFWGWFKGSKVVDSKGRPMVMYHGTNADFARFSYEFADVGVGALGMGFYFTNEPGTASGYAKDNVEGGNVIPVYLNLKNPMNSESTKSLTRAQVKKLLLLAPNLNDSLSNFGDVEYEGKARVLNDAIDEMSDCCNTLLLQLNYIASDFYNGQNEAFLNGIKAVTKFDGVEHRFDSGEVFYVVWDPRQVVSAVGASGRYTGDDLVSEN